MPPNVRFFAGFTSSLAFRYSVIFIVRLKKFQIAPRCSVCLPSCNCPFRILDVERPCPSTTYFEKIGLTRRCSEPPTSSAIYGYGKFEPQHRVLNAHRPAVAEPEG